jgi:hypothetical protein
VGYGKVSSRGRRITENVRLAAKEGSWQDVVRLAVKEIG